MNTRRRSIVKPGRIIRAGLIRCDTHGMYYGPLMQRHDPLLFREPMPVDQPNTYSWQRGGCWYYFYTNYSKPTQLTAEAVGGFEITKLWDENRQAAEMAAKVFYDKPTVCDSFEECSDGVDLVFINDCNFEGEDHLKLATPGLKKGVATFVDKPFAFTLSDVFEMFRLADKHGTVICSTSMLRFAGAAQRFKARFPEAGGVNFGTITGFGTALNGLIHNIAVNQAVFGTGVQTVSVMKASNQTVIHFDYGGLANRPAHGVAIHGSVGPTFHGAMYLTAHGPRNMVMSEQIGDWEHPQSAANVLKAIRRWMRTGELPVPRREMVECIAIAEAFRKAHKSGRPAGVKNELKPYLKIMQRW